MRRSILALALMALAGCHGGDFTKQNATEVMLQANNYRVVMSGIRGEDSGFRVFGLGGWGQYSRAMDKIRVQAQLDDRSRALINVTEDTNWWTIGIVGGDTLTLTADVVEFTGPPTGGN